MIKFKLWALQLLLWLKNPWAYHKAQKFEKSVDKLEASVKQKVMDKHELTKEMNGFAFKKLKKRAISDWHLHQLLHQKFKEEMRELRLTKFRVVKGRISGLQ